MKDVLLRAPTTQFVASFSMICLSFNDDIHSHICLIARCARSWTNTTTTNEKRHISSSARHTHKCIYALLLLDMISLLCLSQFPLCLRVCLSDDIKFHPSLSLSGVLFVSPANFHLFTGKFSFLEHFISFDVLLSRCHHCVTAPLTHLYGTNHLRQNYATKFFLFRYQKKLIWKSFKFIARSSKIQLFIEVLFVWMMTLYWQYKSMHTNVTWPTLLYTRMCAHICDFVQQFILIFCINCVRISSFAVCSFSHSFSCSPAHQSKLKTKHSTIYANKMPSKKERMR